MNKLYFVLLIGFFNHIGLAQRWVDSIDVAKKAYRNKDYRTADRIYNAQYKKAKTKGGIDEELAQSQYRQRNFDRALYYYKKKLGGAKSNTERARIQRNIGNSLFEKGNYKGAIDAYKKSIRLNPNDDETRYNLSQALRQNQSQKNQQQKNNKKQNNPNKSKNNNQKQQKNQNQQNQKNKQSNNKSNQDKPSSGSKLPKKEVDRKLDQLAKKEGETRRKLNKNKPGKSTDNSNDKDW